MFVGSTGTGEERFTAATLLFFYFISVFFLISYCILPFSFRLRIILCFVEQEHDGFATFGANRFEPCALFSIWLSGPLAGESGPPNVIIRALIFVGSPVRQLVGNVSVRQVSVYFPKVFFCNLKIESAVIVYPKVLLPVGII